MCFESLSSENRLHTVTGQGWHSLMERYEKVSYWDFNWRKKGGSSRMIEISKREEFYQQEYCGCVYSFRDTNIWRQKNSREKITIGKNHYTNLIKKTTKNQ